MRVPRAWATALATAAAVGIIGKRPATSAGLAAFSTSSIRVLIRPSRALSFRFRRSLAKLALKRTFHVRPREWRRLHFG
jgi:hypothetical protein